PRCRDVARINVVRAALRGLAIEARCSHGVAVDDATGPRADVDGWSLDWLWCHVDDDGRGLRLGYRDRRLDWSSWLYGRVGRLWRGRSRSRGLGLGYEPQR